MMMLRYMVVAMSISLHSHQQDCPATCSCYLESPPGGIVVDCKGRNLTTIPEHIPANVAALLLSDNQIKTLQAGEFSGFLKMKNLTLSHNGLFSIPSNWFESNMNSLKMLNLSYNLISHVPSNLPTSLKVLYFEHNRLDSIDATRFKDLINLEELYLGNNILNEIQEFAPKCASCSGLSNLQKLGLNQNYIREISKDVFRHLPSLKALTIAGNQIPELRNGAFNGLSELNFLDLSDNKLVAIENGTFSRLVALKYLYLKNNALTEIPLLLPMLEWLDLSSNKIETVKESSTKSSIYPVEVFVLAHNPFHCDCHLLWLKELYDRREYILNYINVPILDFVPVCATPPEVAGESWDVLADSMFSCPEEEGSMKTDSQIGEASSQDVMLTDEAGYVAHEGLEITTPVEVTVAVGIVNTDSLTVQWTLKGRPHKDTLFVQYYKFGQRASTSSLIQVTLPESQYTLHHLTPATNYIVCIIPKTLSSELAVTNMDQCVEATTKSPSSMWERFTETWVVEGVWYNPRILAGSFIATSVIVGLGFAIYELMNSKSAEVGSDDKKQHID